MILRVVSFKQRSYFRTNPYGGTAMLIGNALMSKPTESRQHWQLDPTIDMLNHGSFGATPTVVLQEQRRLQDSLEREPLRFLAQERELEPKLDVVRRCIANLVHVDPTDLVFVRNATDGVNAVLRSMPLGRNDEIVVTDHGYNACNNVARFVTDRAAAKLRVARIPFPLASDDDVVAAIEAELNPRTRLLLVDHVTSASGLVLPIKKIVDIAHCRGIQVMVDGAHAPGMVPLDITNIGPDYYTANHHKWLCGPKVSGFLYVRSELQDQVRPTIISHGANTPRPGRSRFLAEFDWTGTYDPCPLLATPTAIEFLGGLREGGIEALMRANRALALRARDLVLDALEIPGPAPDRMIGSMASFPLPAAPQTMAGEVDPLQVRLYDRHRIELPVFRFTCDAKRVLRISCQAYNDLDQYRRLAEALRAELC